MKNRPNLFSATARLKLFFCMALLALQSGGVFAQTKFPQNNSYTAEATLTKELRNFPHLTLASPSIPDSVKAWLNQPYKTLTNRSLALDVFAPKQILQPLPAIILVHGGGWRSGDKTMLRPLAVGLAQKGFVVASVSYRLSPEAPFPAGFYDVVDAFQWFKRQGHKFGANTQFIAIGGSSAGGQLASLVAYSHGVLMPNAASGKKSKIGKLNSQPTKPVAKNVKTVEAQALLNIDGLLDFTSDEALPFENDPKRKITSASAWLGGKYEQVPETWKIASAYFYTSATSPPTLFLNSARERFHAGRDATMEKLDAFNVWNKMITIKNTPHTFWLFEQWLPIATREIADFLTPLSKPQQAIPSSQKTTESPPKP